MKIGIRVACCCVLLAMALLVGCGTQIPPEPPASSPPAAPVAADTPASEMDASTDSAPVEPLENAVSPPAMAETSAGPELVAPAQAQPASPEPATDMERVKAERGVAAAGRSLDEHQGMLVTPAKAYFSVRERAVFDIQVPEALKLFKATNGNGPRSHDEFMAQIIQANQIQLPELPDGQRYVYDPETEQLMVERPAR